MKNDFNDAAKYELILELVIVDTPKTNDERLKELEHIMNINRQISNKITKKPS